MPFIRESIVTTRNPDATAHIAPMGIHESGSHLVIAPFKPSKTLLNLERNGVASINYTDDIRIFAGCVTGRYHWPVQDADTIPAPRLQSCLAHSEVRVERVEQDELRPRYYCRVEHEVTHAPFHGFNRAQAAVIEAAILVTRLRMLPAEKIDREVEYLRIAINKAAGEREQEAWDWVMDAIGKHRAQA